jgi:hypothetical protein
MDIPPDLIITMNDIRRAGHCPSGTRRWFDERADTLGIDFRTFLKNGIPATDLAATGDGLAIQVVERTMIDRRRG